MLKRYKIYPVSGHTRYPESNFPLNWISGIRLSFYLVPIWSDRCPAKSVSGAYLEFTPLDGKEIPDWLLYTCTLSSTFKMYFVKKKIYNVFF